MRVVIRANKSFYDIQSAMAYYNDKNNGITHEIPKNSEGSVTNTSPPVGESSDEIRASVPEMGL